VRHVRHRAQPTSDDHETIRHVWSSRPRAGVTVLLDGCRVHDVPMASAVVVRRVQPEDRKAWGRLFAAYRDFYELAPSPAVLDRVWTWIHDPSHETGALVALVDGEVVGLAHHRLYARPAEGETGLYLDDLFTAPDARGRGVGRALLSSLADLAREHGAAKVRWMTAADNHDAQRLYDAVAQRTAWVTYDLPV
jgi:GNAT superfamily N-acetyltransferase